jgi:hypothetical protein
VTQSNSWDAQAEQDDDDEPDEEPDDEEPANDQDGPLDRLNGNTEITIAADQGDSPGITSSGRLQFVENFTGAISTKTSGP